MDSLTGVQPRDPKFYFWNVSVHEGFGHSLCHIVAKLLYMFSNILEKGVTGPSVYNHDGIDLDLIQKHDHCGSRTYEVSFNLEAFESKFVFSCCLLPLLRLALKKSTISFEIIC